MCVDKAVLVKWQYISDTLICSISAIEMSSVLGSTVCANVLITSQKCSKGDCEFNESVSC